MPPAGYSGTPLVKKLGLKTNQVVKIIHPPVNYFELLIDLPAGIVQADDRKIKKDFIHYFTKDLKSYLNDIVNLRNEIKPDGMIWISWPKKASGITTDVSEDLIRNHALKNGLVDIKVCAVDENWSGLKLVIPVNNRKDINK